MLRQNRRDLLQTNEPFIQANVEIDEPCGERHNTKKETQNKQNDTPTTKTDSEKQSTTVTTRHGQVSKPPDYYY